MNGFNMGHQNSMR